MTQKAVEKLRKLFAMLDSPEVHEQEAAMHRIADLLRSQGMTFVEFATRLEIRDASPPPRDPPPHRGECREWVSMCDDLLAAEAFASQNEREFLRTVRKWAARGKPPSEKQQVWLHDIAERAGAAV